MAVTELLVVLAIVVALLSTAFAAYYQPTAAAHRALHQMLERGEIRSEDYARYRDGSEQTS